MMRILWRRLVAFLFTTALIVTGLTLSEQPAEAAPRPLKVSIANIGMAKKPRIGAILDKRPHVVVISEAKRARTHLRTVGKRRGYRLRQYSKKHGEEAPNMALLIRKDVRIVDQRLLRMSEPWWYNGNKRKPRRYPVIKVRVNGKQWNVIGVHFPPGGPDGGGSKTGGRNGPAWRESKRAIQRYAANHPKARVVAAGDFNGTHRECVRHFPGFRVKQGGKVDHAMAKKDRGVRFVWVKRHRPKVGHGWFTFKLRAT